MRQVLREARIQSGMTANALSVKLQTNLTYISRVERGYRSIDIVEFTDIANALGVDPRILYAAFLERVNSGR